MNECISESDCVCEWIIPGSVSLLVVKLLWDLVVKTCLNFSVSKLFYWEITEQCWQYISVLNDSVRVICVWCIVRATVCSLCVCVTVQQRIRLKQWLIYLYNKLFKTCILPFNFEHPVIESHMYCGELSEYELICNFNCLETEHKCGFLILLRPL